LRKINVKESVYHIYVTLKQGEDSREFRKPEDWYDLTKWEQTEVILNCIKQAQEEEIELESR